jgi:hypothetical protein
MELAGTYLAAERPRHPTARLRVLLDGSDGGGRVARQVFGEIQNAVRLSALTYECTEVNALLGR